MLTQAVDDYLAVRRAAGFKLKTTEQYLRYFVRLPTPKETPTCERKARSIGRPKPRPRSSATGATNA